MLFYESLQVPSIRGAEVTRIWSPIKSRDSAAWLFIKKGFGALSFTRFTQDKVVQILTSEGRWTVLAINAGRRANLDSLSFDTSSQSVRRDLSGLSFPVRSVSADRETRRKGTRGRELDRETKKRKKDKGIIFSLSMTDGQQHRRVAQGFLRRFVTKNTSDPAELGQGDFGLGSYRSYSSLFRNTLVCEHVQCVGPAGAQHT